MVEVDGGDGWWRWMAEVDGRGRSRDLGGDGEGTGDKWLYTLFKTTVLYT